MAREIDESFNFGRYIFPYSLQALEILKKLGEVKIYTSGDKKYQQRKIQACGIQIECDVYTDKVREISRYGREVIVIDDSEDVLRKLPPYVRKIKIGSSSEFESYPNLLEAALALASSK
ncbi:MAG: hypothetical protein QXM38_01030 [Candidatus Aenigmatarchaeota archaeon]